MATLSVRLDAARLCVRLTSFVSCGNKAWIPAENGAGIAVRLREVDRVKVHCKAMSWILSLQVVQVALFHKLHATPCIGKHAQSHKGGGRDKGKTQLLFADGSGNAAKDPVRLLPGLLHILVC